MKFPFPRGVRFGLVCMIVLLTIVDAWMLFKRLEPGEATRLVVEFRSLPVELDPVQHEGSFKLKSPAQLMPDGRSWLVDGLRVGNLTKYVEEQIALSRDHAGYDDNLRVHLGWDQTYGRAIEALTQLAREGTCEGGIYDPYNDEQWPLLQIGLYRDRNGRLATCQKDDFTEAYR